MYLKKFCCNFYWDFYIGIESNCYIFISFLGIYYSQYILNNSQIFPTGNMSDRFNQKNFQVIIVFPFLKKYKSHYEILLLSNIFIKLPCFRWNGMKIKSKCSMFAQTIYAIKFLTKLLLWSYSSLHLVMPFCSRITTIFFFGKGSHNQTKIMSW